VLRGNENLYGYKEIAEFREARSSANFVRTVTQLETARFDKDFASITLEFECGSQRGCQSLTMVSFPQGWRSIAARVSLIASL
jgi:hypothetical protein